MESQRSLLRRVLVLLVALALVATACGADDAVEDAADAVTDAVEEVTDSGDDDSEDAAPADSDDEAMAEELTGEFLVSGSSTVFPIVNKQAEEFGAANPGVAIAVEGPGSGDGAKLFCAGDIPVGNASRRYKDSELEECAANGIEFIELRRGIDGISVITSAENDAIDCLSFDALYALISEEAIGFTSWADANALLADMGSSAPELPDAPLDIYAPGEESGTFDSFAEIVMEEVAGGDTGLDADAREFVETVRPDYNSSPDDNIIVEGISGNQFSLGWVGFAFASEAAAAGEAKLIDIEVAPGDGCVTPTPESIAAAEFPISRFLYTYINADMAANDPSVEAFVDYMMSDTGLESVTAVGYIDLSEADQSKAQTIWENRITGVQWAAEAEAAPADESASGLTGEFLVSGSSTVFPIVNRQAEEFGAANPGVAIAVEGPGSGDGAKLFCAGEIPVGNASRRYKDSELEECTANGIEFIELRRGIDGISVITSAENDAIECLSFDHLYALLSDEAIGFTSWADANALLADMGSSASELPDAPLDIYAPGEESGTFDSFGEIVMEEVAGGDTGLDADAREFVESIRPDYNSSPDDNIIVEGISGNQFSLGWVGFAFASEAAAAGEAKLIDIEVAPGDGCVTPTPESIAAADFPISRFLYTYINADMAANDPSVQAFVDYMMSDTGLEAVTGVGYIDLSEADQSKAQTIWENRITGVQWAPEPEVEEATGAAFEVPEGLEGEFLVSGSSTVFPIVNRQAEEFGALAPGVAIAVEGPGSGDGAKLFCAGDIPVGNASRRYKDSELEECTANGIEFIELRRGIDGISVITSAENDAIECLSFDHLYALLSDEAIGFTSWADANALLADMGSSASELPDAPLDVYAPGEESGTFDSFGEIVMEDVAGGDTGLDADAREFVESIRPDYNSSPDDNIIVEGISGNQFSLGWVGFAFASEAAAAGEAKLIDIEVAPGDGCVTPTAETIAAAEFPISRFLYTYINADAAANDPAVEAFVNYMMSDTGLEAVTGVGYIDLSDADQAKAQDIWANRTTGVQWE